jgi:hypothetical protein
MPYAEFIYYLEQAGIEPISEAQFYTITQVVPKKDLLVHAKNASRNESAKRIVIRHINNTSIQELTPKVSLAATKTADTHQMISDKFCASPVLGHHLYNKHTAFYVRPSLNQKAHETFHTLTIEGAVKKDGCSWSAAWKNKLIFQLTKDELPQFLGLLLLEIDSLTFTHVYNREKKTLTLKGQKGEGIYGQLTTSTQTCAIKATPGDYFYLVTLTIKAMRENTPWLNTDDLIRVCRVTAKG